ncbi:MAG: manganese efflux pump MntP family protein [Neisseria sp.]|nr:manganese efflux pump MntP family protein [Neisseria sp.]
MSFYALLVLAFAMSVDAFAAAMAKGAAYGRRLAAVQTIKTALVFGIVEGITPLIGWLGGSLAKPFIEEWDHWIAFTLLFALGAKMIYGAFSDGNDDEETAKGSSFLLTLLTAVATSIDSMIVGVGLAFMEVNILTAALTIGLTTTTMSAIGLSLGGYLGSKAGKYAEILGGLVLIAIGASILTEHLGLLG